MMPKSPSDLAAVESLLKANIAASAAMMNSLSTLAEPLARAVRLVTDCLLGGNKLLTCGNGGSAADASHIATEFVARYQSDRRPYPAIALTEPGSTITAISNDYSFELVFARQVRAFGRKGDVLIAITTSGKSKNISLALEAAKEVGIASIALLGKGGGFTRGIATVDLIVPGDVTARIQESHLLLYHCLCESVDAALLKAEGR
jgi:D-sedoheptulose 7-phosphate isomerase